MPTASFIRARPRPRRAVAVSALLAATAVASAAPLEGDDALTARLDTLEARLARLESAPPSPLDERRATEIRALVLDVLDDADRRAALLDDDAVAGWDDGFFLASADGDFFLEVSGQIQFRYVYNRQQVSADGDDDRSGFELRRTKIKAKGHLVSPDLKYSVQVASDRFTGGMFMMQDAYIEYAATDELDLRIGRFRPPLLREEFVSSKRQLTAERSLIARTFRQDRTVGFQARWEGESLRLFGSFMDTGSGLFVDESWQAVGRAEVLLAGSWKRLKDFTSFPDDEPTVALGVGILRQDADFGDPAKADFVRTRLTADASVELGGATLFAAVVSNRLDEVGMPVRNQLGFVVHGGLFLDEEWEVFARYSWGDADGAAADLSVVELGVNRYFARHDLKWTADIGFGLRELGDFWDSDGAGWREDAPGEDGQTVIRVQCQLLF